MDLFATKGYRGAGLAEVAARVGITQAGLLYHFRSKEILLQAVMEHRDADSEAYAKELLKQNVQAVLDALPEFARLNRDQPELPKLFTVLVAENLEEDGPAHNHFVRRYRSLRGIVATIIRKGQQQGYTRTDVDPDMKAAEIIGALDGLQTQWLLDPEEIDIVAAVSAYAVALRKALSTSPEGT